MWNSSQAASSAASPHASAARSRARHTACCCARAPALNIAMRPRHTPPLAAGPGAPSGPGSSVAGMKSLHTAGGSGATLSLLLLLLLLVLLLLLLLLLPLVLASSGALPGGMRKPFFATGGASAPPASGCLAAAPFSDCLTAPLVEVLMGAGAAAEITAGTRPGCPPAATAATGPCPLRPSVSVCASTGIAPTPSPFRTVCEVQGKETGELQAQHAQHRGCKRFPP